MFIQYNNPAAFPPLEHSSRIFADNGWQVMFLGISAPEIDALRFPPHDRIEVRQMSHCPPGWRQKAHYLRFALWALWWTLHWRPDWMYASDLLSCPVALLLSFLPGMRVIYHEHDSPLSSGGNLFQRLSMAGRRGSARRAKVCILPNQERADRFVAEVNARPDGDRQTAVVVWNCPSREEVSPERTAKNEVTLLVYYHGNLSADLLPPTVIDAIAKASGDVRLIVAGYETMGWKGYSDLLKRKAEQLGIADNVHFLGPKPRHELWRSISGCDVGLALIPANVTNPNLRYLIGASNKTFDYMACGLALLVSDSADWNEMYVRPGYGLSCNPADPDSIASALHWFLDHPVKMRAMGERGRRKIAEEWNYENQFSPVLERMNSYLK